MDSRERKAQPDSPEWQRIPFPGRMPAMWSVIHASLENAIFLFEAVELVMMPFPPDRVEVPTHAMLCVPCKESAFHATLASLPPEPR